jgi:gamma-tubulin complex component 4
MPSFGFTVKSSQVDAPKANDHTDRNPRSALSNASEISLDGWDGIALEYSVDWPLELFFTQEVLSK